MNILVIFTSLNSESLLADLLASFTISEVKIVQMDAKKKKPLSVFSSSAALFYIYYRLSAFSLRAIQNRLQPSTNHLRPQQKTGCNATSFDSFPSHGKSPSSARSGHRDRGTTDIPYPAKVVICLQHPDVGTHHLGRSNRYAKAGFNGRAYCQ